jgi:hypothetical protein
MTILRNVLAVILGLVLGSAVNMSLILLGPNLIPPPAGVVVTDSQSLAASMHLFGPQQFLFPFLAHALGTLAGALTAYLVAGSRRQLFAYVIGVLSLVGGVAAAVMLPAPLWFEAVDLLFAYIPMAWFGILLGRRILGNAAGKN